MSKNRLPAALPPIPVQLDLNAPGAVEKLFYGERQASDQPAEQSSHSDKLVAAPETSQPQSHERPADPQPSPAMADEFAATLERLKGLGPRGERPHHVHLPDSLDIALRRFAADRKTKATNVLIVALMEYLAARDAAGSPISPQRS
jgi:hypothetical protein